MLASISENARHAMILNFLGDKFHMHVGVSGNHVVVDLVGGVYPE